MQRLFVAVDLPEAVKAQLKALCIDLAGAKWVSYPQMHLTLRFIGDADAAQQAHIQTGLATIRATPFKMALQGIGQFPTKGKPRVLWVGIEANSELYTLQNKIERVIRDSGFEAADHAFSPHITLARFKTPPSLESLQHYMARHQLFKTDSFEVGIHFVFQPTRAEWLDLSSRRHIPAGLSIEIIQLSPKNWVVECSVFPAYTDI